MVAIPDAPHAAGIPGQKDAARVPYFLVRLRSGSRAIWWQMTLDHRFGPPFEGWEPDKADLELAAALRRAALPVDLLVLHYALGLRRGCRPRPSRLLAACLRRSEVRHLRDLPLGPPITTATAVDGAMRRRTSFVRSSSPGSLVTEAEIVPSRAASCWSRMPTSPVHGRPAMALRASRTSRRSCTAGEPRLGDPFSFPGAGTVRALAALQGRGGTTHYLLAGPGATGGTDLRFYLATPDAVRLR